MSIITQLRDRRIPFSVVKSFLSMKGLSDNHIIEYHALVSKHDIGKLNGLGFGESRHKLVLESKIEGSDLNLLSDLVNQGTYKVVQDNEDGQIYERNGFNFSFTAEVNLKENENR